MSFDMSFNSYIILINIIGFIFYWIYSKVNKRFIKNISSTMLFLICIGGGPLGTVLAILIFDRNTKKQGLSLKVFAFVSLFIELILYIIYNKNLDKINLNFIGFFRVHPYLILYLLVINFLNFLAFFYDKYKAKREDWRLPNGLLLGLSFVGGSIGGYLAMKLFRHKTKKSYYRIGLPLMVFMHILVLVYFMN